MGPKSSERVLEVRRTCAGSWRMGRKSSESARGRPESAREVCGSAAHVLLVCGEFSDASKIFGKCEGVCGWVRNLRKLRGVFADRSGICGKCAGIARSLRGDPEYTESARGFFGEFAEWGPKSSEISRDALGKCAGSVRSQRGGPESSESEMEASGECAGSVRGVFGWVGHLPKERWKHREARGKLDGVRGSSESVRGFFTKCARGLRTDPESSGIAR